MLEVTLPSSASATVPKPSQHNPPTHRHSSTYCFWTSFLLAILGILGSLFFNAVNTLIEEIIAPHQGFYYYGSKYNTGFDAAVYPLINFEQSFDVLATIWLRDAEDVKYRSTRLGPQRLDDPDEPLHETVLYSGIVFHGLKISDKTVRSNVSFNLPTAPLSFKALDEMDLRGSFVLMPASPSPLDYLAKYVSYLSPPKNANVPSIEYWPSRPSCAGHKQTPQDGAISTLSVTFPLLAFYDVSNLCSPRTRSSPPAQNLNRMTEDMFSGQISLPSDAESKRNVQKGHPHVITRTHLRLIDETHPFELKPFIAKEVALINSVCGYVPNQTLPKRSNCIRTYRTHGHWETKFQIEIPDSNSSNGTRTELRYSPYMDVQPAAYSHKDLVPLPVKSKECRVLKRDRKLKADQDSISIDWKISFSGMSFKRALLANSVIRPPRPDMHEISDYEQAVRYDNAELLQGMVGHVWSDNSYSRCRFLLLVLIIVTFIIKEILLAHYWYTVPSLAGISTFATGFSATLEILNRLCLRMFSIFDDISLHKTLLFLLYSGSTLLKLKRVLRLGVGFWGPIPVLRRVPTTHRERHTQRVDDALLSSMDRFSYICLSAAIVFQFRLDEVYLTPHLQDPSTAYKPPIPHVVAILTSNSVLAANVSQCLLNWRTGTFAGWYRAQTFVMCAGALSALAFSLPAVVGAREAPTGLTLTDVPGLILPFVAAWQALTLSPVQHEDVDGEK